jgi:uncharacterized protein
MVIGSMRVRLHIQDANSLKDKRSILKKTIHRLRTTFNCAVAEVDDQDVWRSAVLAIVTVYSRKSEVESLFSSVLKDLARAADFELIDQEIEIL